MKNEEDAGRGDLCLIFVWAGEWVLLPMSVHSLWTFLADQTAQDQLVHMTELPRVGPYDGEILNLIAKIIIYPQTFGR